jgi:hypothetical protein
MMRSLAVSIALLAATACALHRGARAPADPCWTTNPPTYYLERDAINTLLGMKNSTGERLRSLAGVPLLADSVRAHAEFIRDPATCARLWKALDTDVRGPHVAALHIGNTYWVRSGSGFTSVYRLPGT